jgi:hypothetical protein
MYIYTVPRDGGGVVPVLQLSPVALLVNPELFFQARVRGE